MSKSVTNIYLSFLLAHLMWARRSRKQVKWWRQCQGEEWTCVVRCARCLGTALAIDEREVSEVEVGNEKLEVVPEFCYLAALLAAITRCKCAWGKFRQLLPLLTNRYLPLLTRGKVYSSSVRSVMLHAAETLA